MKKLHILICFALAILVLVACKKDDPTTNPNNGTDTIGNSYLNGESGITYQILVYSFADSDGDGCGDFKGIEQRLDYLRDLGVQALWLSPIHPASSYHGYDVLDYSSVNPDYGTEDDLRSLINAAHDMDIKIFLDYVLNHSSSGHPWFLDAKTGEDSPYRDYYIFSDDPYSDITAGNIPMISSEGSSGYDSGQWFYTVSGGGESWKVKFSLTVDDSGNPSTLTVEQVDEISNSGSQSSGIYLYYGDEQMEEFYVDNSTYSLSIDLDSHWGVLIRTSKIQWGNYKYGASSSGNRLEWSVPLSLISGESAADILMPYMGTTMYHSHMWTSWFADLNYGSAETCETSPAFIALCESADKWITMGVDGFRLDAIKHIYHNAYSDENPTFLKKFYDYCNATYKANGGEGDIYMVGEHFSEASEVAPYYTGLPAYFEFSFWWTLKDAINNGVGNNFVGTIQSYQNMYAQYRSDYIEATKLSNHDEERAAESLLRNESKMKLAGAVLLTGPGEPYIYQGEELGYWGSTSNGDEYVRTPIMWNADGSNLASAMLSGKVDMSMLSSYISVESQLEDDDSILNVYRNFGQLRASYPALAKGSFDYCASAAATYSASAWYRTLDDQRILVVHNFGAGTININFSNDSLENMIGSNGSVSISGSRLTLGSYSTAVFLL